jgi:hypothetical protein
MASRKRSSSGKNRMPHRDRHGRDKFHWWQWVLIGALVGLVFGLVAVALTR